MTSTSANKASWVANGIACLALIIAIISAIVSCQQLSEAQRANDLLLETKASNVFFDSTRNGDGTIIYFIKNRNKEPVLDVYYTYRMANLMPKVYVFLGIVAACSSVQLTPPDGSRQTAEFAPVELFLKDNDGNSWWRDELNHIHRVDENHYTQRGRDISALSVPIQEGC